MTLREITVDTAKNYWWHWMKKRSRRQVVETVQKEHEMEKEKEVTWVNEEALRERRIVKFQARITFTNFTLFRNLQFNFTKCIFFQTGENVQNDFS